MPKGEIRTPFKDYVAPKPGYGPDGQPAVVNSHPGMPPRSPSRVDQVLYRKVPNAPSPKERF